MDILRKNTVKSLLSKVNLLIESSENLENNEILRELLVRVVEVANGDKRKLPGKGLKGKFWKIFFRVYYLVNLASDKIQRGEEGFVGLKEIFEQVKESVEECVEICFDRKLFFEENEIEVKLESEDWERFNDFFKSISSMFFNINKKILVFDKILQKQGLYLKLLKNYSMAPTKCSCSEDFKNKLESLQSEKSSLELKLKHSEALLTETRQEKEILNSIVYKVKEKLISLKFSNSQISSFIPSPSSLTPRLSIQKDLNTISICGSKSINSHKNPDNSSSIQAINSSLDLLITMKTHLSLPKSPNEKNLIPALIKNLLEKINELEIDFNSRYKNTQDPKRTPKSEEKKIEILPFKLSKRKNEELKKKLLRKKNKIQLHKDQILVLKSRIRELQTELELSGNNNLIHIRELWWTFAKEVPVLDKKVEETFSVFTRMLGFTSKDLLWLTNERTLKKPKLKFGLF